MKESDRLNSFPHPPTAVRPSYSYHFFGGLGPGRSSIGTIQLQDFELERVASMKCVFKCRSMSCLRRPRRGVEKRWPGSQCGHTKLSKSPSGTSYGLNLTCLFRGAVVRSLPGKEEVREGTLRDAFGWSPREAALFLCTSSSVSNGCIGGIGGVSGEMGLGEEYAECSVLDPAVDDDPAEGE